MFQVPRQSLAGLLALVLLSVAHSGGADVQPPDFAYEIRPILAKNCFSCHGPDESHRESELRLDVRNGAIESGVLVPGSPDESELVRRITSEDVSERMPPVESGHRLAAAEIDKITAWIAAGAEYSQHWSYTPPQRPPLPMVSQPDWCRNAIDYFILAGLDEAGLAPEPEADRYRLIRRLSLDLIGLPPTLEEVDEFVEDQRSDAYERLVDRLLRSPAYGENWAVKWLDLARYADTCGYEKDTRRTIWPYRDWVIKALNDDMPFDQFSIEQLAGDLLPDPTREQLIATAFHRNTMQNDEGGTDDEEFRDAAVVDRVNTTMQVWMGTTMGCCRCHSHKYDPLSQREYYQLFAFFNQTADADRFDQEPTLLTPTDEQLKLKTNLEKRLAECKKLYDSHVATSGPDQRKWEAIVARDVEWKPLKIVDAVSLIGANCTANDDGTLSIDATNAADSCTLRVCSDLRRITALRFELLSPGVGFVISRIRAVPAQPAAEGVKYVRVELPNRHDYLALAEVQVYRGDKNVAARGKASQSSTAYEGPAELAIDGRTDGHFATGRSVTHTAFNFNPWWEVELAEPTRVDRVVLWNRDEFSERLAKSRVTLLDANKKSIWAQNVLFAPKLSATLETTGSHPPALLYAAADSEADNHSAQQAIENHVADDRGWSPDSHAPEPHWLVVGFERPWDAISPLELTVHVEFHAIAGEVSAAPPRHFRIFATDDLHAGEKATTPAVIRAAVMTPVAKRTPSQTDALARYYRAISPEFRRLIDERTDIEYQLSERLVLDKTPIMRELPLAERRKTHVHIRGSYLSPGELVEPGTPSTFPPFPTDASGDRLGLAHWLVDRRNPLTARVAANRQWEQLFGIGIVATSEDFGSQGTLPSHPELLDWLAIELMDNGWSLKHLTKSVVMSAAYRQSSRLTRKKLEKDPDNRLVSRGPRVRLSAEQLRDQGLFVSGLLSRKMLGPSVMPPQPDGVWQVVYSYDTWQLSEGEDRYRRGLYTYWRRTSPYPSAMAFDATSRETCTIRRTGTNTPVAAFALLNDPACVEAAQALARRIAAKADGNAAAGAAYAIREVLLRPPTPKETERLLCLFKTLRRSYNADMVAANQMATSELGPVEGSASVADLAAWTVVSNVLLNLDETMTN